VTARPLRRLSLAIRGTVPLILALALVLLSVVAYGVPDLAVVTPSFGTMAVYYWAIYRPDLLPAPAAFLIGLAQDVLGGGPTGLMALVLLLVHAVTVSQRRVFVGKSFLVGWWGFAIIASGAGLLTWLAAAAWFGALPPVAPSAYQTLLTIVLYPCIAWLFSRVHLTLLREV
jgi:rod shape-determining protein MreD